MQCILFLFFDIDFWELFAKNVLYWINLQVIHYFVLTLDCLRITEFFLQYVDERYQNPYTTFHIVFMIFTIGVVLWMWHIGKKRGFIRCPNKKGYLFLSVLAVGEVIIAKLCFTKEQAIRVVTKEFVLFLVLLLFLFLCLFIVFLVMRYNWEIQYQDQMLRMNYSMMKNQYRLIEEMYNEKRRYLHDMKHQHLLLEDYLVRGKKDEALSYIMPVTGTVLLADVFFAASETGFGSVLVLYLWKNTGYSMILLLAGLMTIPQEQYNCAKLDGAGEIQMFFYITTPQMWYSLFFTFLFSMINGFKCFREIFLLGGEHPDKQVYMLQHYLNNNFESLNYRNLSAVSVLLFLVITIVLGLAYAGVLRKEAYKS